MWWKRRRLRDVESIRNIRCRPAGKVARLSQRMAFERRVLPDAARLRMAAFDEESNGRSLTSGEASGGRSPASVSQ